VQQESALGALRHPIPAGAQRTLAATRAARGPALDHRLRRRHVPEPPLPRQDPQPELHTATVGKDVPELSLEKCEGKAAGTGVASTLWPGRVAAVLSPVILDLGQRSIQLVERVADR
jgi:hypothetical protein